MRLGERGCLWNPMPLSLKMRSFLDSIHLIHNTCAGDAVRFRGCWVSKPPAFVRRYLNFFSVQHFFRRISIYFQRRTVKSALGEGPKYFITRISSIWAEVFVCNNQILLLALPHTYVISLGRLTVHLSITLVWSPTWCTKFLFIHI